MLTPSRSRAASNHRVSLVLPLLVVLFFSLPSAVLTSDAPSPIAPGSPSHLVGAVSSPSDHSSVAGRHDLGVDPLGSVKKSSAPMALPSSPSLPLPPSIHPTAPSPSSPRSAPTPTTTSPTSPSSTAAHPTLPNSFTATTSPFRPLLSPEQPYLDGTAATGTCDYPCTSGSLVTGISITTTQSNDQVFVLFNTDEANYLYNGPILASSGCVSSSPSLSWGTLVHAQYEGSAGAYSDEYVYTAVFPGPGTLTTSLNVGCFSAYSSYQAVDGAAGMLYGVAGAAPSGAISVGGFRSCGINTGCPNPNAALTTANTQDTLLLGFVAGTGNGDTATTGWTQIAATLESTYQLEAYSEYQAEAAAGTYTSTPNQPSLGYWGEVVIGVDALAATPITPTNVVYDSGQGVTLTANPSGGTTPFTNYAFYSSSSNTGSCTAGTSTQSGASATYAYTAAVGTTYYCNTVTDSATSPRTAASGWDKITVDTAMATPSTPTVAAAALDVDQTQTISDSLPTTGTAPYSWTWEVQVGGTGPFSTSTVCATNSGTGGASGSGVTCTIGGNTLAVGSSYAFELQVTDSSSTPVTATSSPSTSFAVRSMLTAGSTPTISAALLDLDQAATTVETISSTLPSTGTPTYSWSWYESVNGGAFALSTICATNSGSGASAGAQSCVVAAGTFTATGTYTFEITSTDLATTPESATSARSTLTIDPTLTAPGAPSPQYAVIDADTSFQVSGQLPTTGTPTYSWTWEIAVNGGGLSPTTACITNSGSGGTAGQSVPCQTRANSLTPGTTVAFALQVTDSATTPEQQTSSTSTSVTVNSALQPPPTPTTTATALDKDQSWSASSSLPSSGTAPYTWGWWVAVDGGTPATSTYCAVNSGTAGAANAPETCAVLGNALPSGHSYVFSLQVRDSASLAETTSSAAPAVVVASHLTASTTPSPTAAFLDVDQTLSVSSTLPASGTATYTWAWLVSVNTAPYSAATVCGSSASGSGAAALTVETCVVPGGTLVTGDSYAFELQVKDSATAPEVVPSSPSPTVAVASALTAPTGPTISAAALDADQAWQVSDTLPSTGTTPYAWTWMVSVDSGAATASTYCATNSGTGGGASATETCAVAGSGFPAGHTYVFFLSVSDSASSPESSQSANAPAVVVKTALTASTTPVPSATVLDLDQALSVSGTLPASGTSPYAWSWSLSINGGGFSAATVCGSSEAGTGAAASTPETCAIPGGSLAVGSTYTFQLTVSDSATVAESVPSSSSGSVTVNSMLLAPPIPTTSASALDADQTWQASSSLPSSGSPTYSWTWMVSVDTAPAVVSTYCAVNSGTGGTAAAPETCAISGNTLPSGHSYVFDLAVQDSATLPESTSAAAPAVAVASPLTASSTPVPTASVLDSDQTLSVSATLPSSGTGSYAWTWYISANGGGYSTASVCASSVSGSGGAASTPETCVIPGSSLAAGSTYTFEMQVTDSATLPEVVPSSPSSSVIVNSPLLAPPVQTISAGALDADQAWQTSSSLPTSGSAPYTWAWEVSLDGGPASASTYCTANTGSGAAGASETCSVLARTFLAGHNYVFFLSATDSATVPEVALSGGALPVVVASPLTPSSAPLPGASTLDIDQPLSVTATLPTSGTATYSWSWYMAANGGSYSPASLCGSSGSGTGAGASAPETCTIPGGSLAAGNSYTFEMQVTDSATLPEVATSLPSAAVVTATQLTPSTTPVGSAGLLDADQPYSVSSTLPSTGTLTYAWAWSFSTHPGVWALTTFCAVNAGSGALAGAVETCSVPGFALTAGSTYTFELQTTDSASTPETQTSPASSGVVVSAPLSAPLSPTPSATALDVDQALSVSGTLPSSGTATYAWSWWMSTNGGAYASATLCAKSSGSGGLAGAAVTCAIAGLALSAGSSYAFELSATDSASAPESQTSSASASVVVAATLNAAAIAPVSPAIDTGQAVVLTGAGAGGSGSLHYQWFTGSNCAVAILGAAFATVSASPTSTTTYSYQVSDSASLPELRCSTPDNVTVNPALVAGAILPAAPTLDLGQSITLYSVPSAGTPGYTFQWYTGSSATCSLNTAVAGATSSTYRVSPTASTQYCYTVTDRSYTPVTVASTTVLVSVIADPTIAPPTASVASVDLGQAVTLSVVASGGSGGFSYVWSGLPPGCGSTSASFTCHPGRQGTYAITVQATDLNGFAVVSSALSFTVYSDPTVSDPNASLANLDLGQSVAFYTVATGGTGSYTTYTWQSPAAFGCDTFGRDPVHCAPTAAGTLTLSVKVTDSNGVSSTIANGSIVVYTDPTVAPPNASLAVGEVGVLLAFSTNATGGFGTLSFAWAGLPSGCAGATEVVSCTPSASGSFSIKVSVVDANAFSVASKPFTFSVDAALETPNLVATTGSMTVGQSVVFTATVSGGVGPYTYGWSGLPSGCSDVNAPSLVCVPSGPGTSTVAVTVTDADGASTSSAPVTLVANTPSSTSFLSSSSGLLEIGGLAVVAVVAALVVLLLYMRRRKPKATRSEPKSETSEWKPPSERSEEVAASPAPTTESPAPPPASAQGGEEAPVEWSETPTLPTEKAPEPVHSLEELK